MGKNVTILMYLILIAIGFYFGKWLGAIGLVAIYFYFSQQKKNAQNTDSLLVEQPTDIAWAYQELGVSQNADKEAIEKARKRLLNHYHPDKLGQATQEEKRLAEKKVDDINRAYQVVIKHKKIK